MYLTPSEPLQPGTHFQVAINTSPDTQREQAFFDTYYGLNPYTPTLPPTGGIQHQKLQENGEGSLLWDFFTTGYVPLHFTTGYVPCRKTAKAR